MTLLRKAAWRLLAGLGVLWGAATVTFVTLHLTPGDPALAVLGGEGASPTPEAMAQVRADYGLDDPLPVQYLAHLGRIVQGDLGESYRLRVPVVDAVQAQLGATAQLAGAAAVIAIVVGLAIALATANRPPAVRGVASTVELVLASMPSFVVGIALLIAFSFTLHWFPVSGNQGLASLVLPALTLGLVLAGALSQVLRSELEDVLEQPFVLTARTRGMRDGAVRVRHALRHALVPLLTMSGFVVGGLLGGSVITETLFVRQGVGALLLQAVYSKDLPVVLGIVLLAAAVYVVVNFVVDLLYTVVDPRVVTA